jgi:hypothetical protein
MRQPIAGNVGKPLLADTSRHPKRVRHPDIRGRSKFCTRHDAGASTIVTASRKRWQHFQLPDGQITRLFERGDFAFVQPCLQKYFYSPQGKSLLHPMPSRPSEGRFAIVTNVGRDAVDADALLTNGAEADGEVVWS